MRQGRPHQRSGNSPDERRTRARVNAQREYKHLRRHPPARAHASPGTRVSDRRAHRLQRRPRAGDGDRRGGDGGRTPDRACEPRRRPTRAGAGDRPGRERRVRALRPPAGAGMARIRAGHRGRASARGAPAGGREPAHPRRRAARRRDVLLGGAGDRACARAARAGRHGRRDRPDRAARSWARAWRTSGRARGRGCSTS